jgi:DNA-directed RNA polymerase specialized sigma24 family protein
MRRKGRTEAASQETNYVPLDYEDLYAYYIDASGNGASLTHQLIRHFVPLASPEERETLAQDVYVRCHEKDMLRVFDPAKSNFGGVIFFVTRSVCVNHLNRKQRDPQTGLRGGSLTSGEVDDNEFEPGVYSLDRLFGTPSPNYERQIDASRIVRKLYDWARDLYEHPKVKRDASLYPLLNLLAEESNPQECGEELGVTPSTIHNWVGVLRQKIKEFRREEGEDEGLVF